MTAQQQYLIENVQYHYVNVYNVRQYYNIFFLQCRQKMFNIILTKIFKYEIQLFSKKSLKLKYLLSNLIFTS